jgi:NTE family protein
MNTERKLGLVLSGGGAKGAYEAGVIRALAELGIEPEVISGASIGSVNGAVVASASSIHAAADELSMIWTGIDSEKVIKAGLTSKRLLALTGLHSLVSRYLNIDPVTLFAGLASKRFAGKLFKPEDLATIALLDQSPLEEILVQTVDFPNLCSPSSKDFYVALFSGGEGDTPDFWKPIIKYAVGAGKSEFKKIKNYSPQDALRLVMASAAIPMAYKPVQIDGKWYYDGGMGKRVNVQGNTPATPLITSGCTHAIVVMLGNGVLWDRYEWPDLTAIEIRPKKDMSGLFAMLDFNPKRIQELMNFGYQDAMESIGKVADALIRRNLQNNAEVSMQNSVKKCCEIDADYEEEMSRYRKNS